MKTFEPATPEEIKRDFETDSFLDVYAYIGYIESKFNEHYDPLLTAYTTLQTELAQVRKERDSANKLLEMAWASVNSSAKVCKNPTDIRLAKMIEAHLTPAAPDNLK